MHFQHLLLNLLVLDWNSNLSNQTNNRVHSCFSKAKSSFKSTGWLNQNFSDRPNRIWHYLVDLTKTSQIGQTYLNVWPVWLNQNSLWTNCGSSFIWYWSDIYDACAQFNIGPGTTCFIILCIHLHLCKENFGNMFEHPCMVLYKETGLYDLVTTNLIEPELYMTDLFIFWCLQFLV